MKCLQCRIEIPRGARESENVYKTRKFCCKSCAASYNNKTPKRKKVIAYCLHCKTELRRDVERFCSCVCFIKYTREQRWNLWDQTGEFADKKGGQLNSTEKSYLVARRGHKCSICGTTEWTGQPVPLEMDHIDGDSTNNKISNVRLVCGNCAMLLPTYKSKNKGKGNPKRRRYYNGNLYGSAK